MEKLEDNMYKLEQLEKIGNEYFKMFGDLMLVDKLTIQQSIDKCFDYFYGGTE